MDLDMERVEDEHEDETHESSSIEEKKKKSEDRRKIIHDALDNKRRLLDEEIATFKSLKDEEFRQYKGCLESIIGDADLMEAELWVESQGLRYRIKKPKKNALSPEQMQRVRDDEILRNLHLGSIGPKEQDAIDRREARKKLAKEKEGHERENEFKGIFTPGFLPLLNGGKEAKEQEVDPVPFLPRRISSMASVYQNRLGPRERARKTSEEREEREQMKIHIAAARRATSAAAPILSSSAVYHHSAMTSPTALPARPLSSSVPPEHQHALDHRRSSSKSDISIDGLRSSLKNPTQPKSPKRVQFSIDDTVVSPSTSPLAKRTSTASASKHSGAAVVSRGFESFEVVKGQRDGKSSSNGPIDDSPSYSSAANVSNVSNGSTAGLSSLGSYFHSRKDSASDPMTAGGEDFDILDGEDDVFSFDEDVNPRASSKEAEVQGDDSIDDVEEDECNPPPLTGSSPHAGSLPIEIKLPLRRGRNGE